VIIQRIKEFAKSKRRIIADSLELAIETALYNPDRPKETSGYPFFVCHALVRLQREGKITEYAWGHTTQYVMNAIHPDRTYEEYLARTSPHFWNAASHEQVQRSRISWFRQHVVSLSAG
jgi:hypothetical protein